MSINMNKTIKLVGQFLFVFLASVLLTRSVFAVEQQARRWVCLDADHQASHVATVKASATGDKPLPGQPTYIFVCIGGKCTTGNSQRDIDATGVDGLKALQGAYGYNFEGMTPATNPVTSDAGGGVGTITWHDSTDNSQTRIWMAMNYWTPNNNNAGTAGGQQQGTFDFETASKKCVSIQWDPFGRVFDSQTLEPVPNASVTLLFKKNNAFVAMTPADLLGGSITNPQITKQDGQFSFVVPDGEYKLVVNPAPVADIKNVHPKYTTAYYDIYPALTGDVIVEQGGAQHRDVPVPTQNTNTEAKIMDYIATQGQGIIYVQGLVSHPLSTVTVRIKRAYTNPVKEEIRDGSSVQADKMGKFAIEINQAEFENTPEYVDMLAGLSAQKVNLLVAQNKQSSLISRIQDLFMKFLGKETVSAQAKSDFIAIEPMLSYIEGYAYDANGTPIPKATVGIYMKSAQRPIYETSADETGYYKIGSEFIPPFEYDLRYKKIAGDVVNTTTSTFLTKNHVFLANNSISTFTYKETGITNTATAGGKTGVLPTTKPGSKTGTKGTSGSLSSGSIGSKTPVQSQTGTQGVSFAGMQGIAMILVVLFVLLLVGVGAFIAMKSKGQQPPSY